MSDSYSCGDAGDGDDGASECADIFFFLLGGGDFFWGCLSRKLRGPDLGDDDTDDASVHRWDGYDVGMMDDGMTDAGMMDAGCWDDG